MTAILKSDTQKNSLVVFTEFIDNNKNPIMVALHLDKNGKLGISNEVASYYGRKEFQNFIEQNRKKEIYYMKKRIWTHFLSMEENFRRWL